jgi:hypothetical protein
MLAELRKHVPASVKTVQAAFEDLQPGGNFGLVRRLSLDHLGTSRIAALGATAGM